jgi:putative ABC transport system permease protein
MMMRIFQRQPAFSALIIAMMAIGIGAVTAAFSVADAVLLRPLPFKDSDRLVWVWSIDSRQSLRRWVSYPDFLDWRSQTQTLQEIAGFGGYEATLTGAGDPERVRAALATNNVLSLLGVPPLLGLASLGDNQTAEHQPVVIGYGLWQRRFGGDPNVTGRAITLNGESHTVLGVMPRTFRFPPTQPNATDVWVLLRPDQFNPALRARRDARIIEVIGRMRPGVTSSQTQAEFDILAAGLARQYPATNGTISAQVVPAQKQVAGQVADMVWLVFGAMVCVLLIACLNVANLLVARGVTRQQEMAVRAALGADRWRVARGLMVETVPLAVAGGVLGTLFAYWALPTLTSRLPAELPRAEEIGIDLRVLGFTVVISLLTGVIFGVLPAWQTFRPDFSGILRQSEFNTSDNRRARRFSSVLVIGEIAAAMVLTIAAALFASSFWRLNQPAHGFDPHNVLTFNVSWPSRYTRPQAGDAFRDLQQQLLTIPGVQSASSGLQLPDRGAPPVDEVLPYVDAEGLAVPASERVRASVLPVLPRYFETLGIPIVNGRDFNDGDRSSAPLVTIINESLARRYFGNENPIGKRLKLDSFAFFGERTQQIVGVASDVVHQGLRDTAAPLVYLPMAHFSPSTAVVVMKTADNPANYVSAVRARLRTLDPDQPLYDVRTLEQRLAQSLAREAFAALALSVFALVSLLLAAGGLYAVLAHAVGRRTREMGIRMSLGADAKGVLRLVVGEGMKVAVIGISLGLAAALASARFIRDMLFGVSPVDPQLIATVTTLLLVVALAACWLPGRKAASVDPITTLRHQ